MVKAAGVLPGATFASELIPIGEPIAQRRQGRHEWLRSIRRRLEAADLLFLDPDNGLEPAGFRPTAAKSGKSIMISEVRELERSRRCLIVYHHHTRRAAVIMPRCSTGPSGTNAWRGYLSVAERQLRCHGKKHEQSGNKHGPPQAPRSPTLHHRSSPTSSRSLLPFVTRLARRRNALRSSLSEDQIVAWSADVGRFGLKG